MSAELRAGAIAAIESALAELDVEHERPEPDHFVVSLPGTRKLSTGCSLLVGDHSLSVNAFVVRSADENHAEVYRWLLERNAKLFGIAFALDHLGDVYLVGRVPLASIQPDEIDRLLGCVLSYSDENFDQALMLGFASSIRREWAWRRKRGESLANLQAFARLADDAPEDDTG